MRQGGVEFVLRHAYGVEEVSGYKRDVHLQRISSVGEGSETGKAHDGNFADVDVGGVQKAQPGS
jgi:hypothetical protein